MESQEKRLHFEARMQTQWEVFVNKMLLMQGQDHGEAESLDAIDKIDDYEEFDKNFPLTTAEYVEELDWTIQTNLPFRRRLVNI